MAATTLFSAPISPHQYPISVSSFGSKSWWQPSSSAAQSQTKSPFILLRASSSTSSSTVDKQEEESSSSDTLTNQSGGGCKACGKAEIGWGCNGEGRIQGGIATVPGFGWWPIKAYRPCPDFVATGGRYRRQGQSMDEVAGFGSVPRISPTSAAATEETQSSDKKQGTRKFKR